MAGGLYTSSAIINGQLVPQARTSFYTPFAVGPIIQGVPASPPQSPPGYSASGGGETSDRGQQAAQNPWNPFLSPVPWLIAMFVVGYILLRYVHWGYE